MNFKKTLIMAAVAIVAVAVLWFDQNRRDKEQARKEAASRLVAPKKEQISELTVHQGAKTLQLVRQGEDWQLTQPLQVRADGPAVNAMLDELDRARRADAFDPKGKLEDFGLKTPPLRLEVKAEVTTGTTKNLEVELGGKTTAGDEVYGHVPKETEIFTVPQTVLTALTKPVNELRYKWILQNGLDDATSAVLSYDGQTVELKKNGTEWSLLRPIQSAADNAKIKELLNNISRVSAADYVDTHPLNMAALGLDKPAVRATFTTLVKDKPVIQTIVVGKDTPTSNGQVYALQEGVNYAMTIARDEVAKLKPNVDDLRSKRLFTLDENNVGRMIFDMRGAKTDVTADTAGKWSYTGDPSAKLDQGEINRVRNELLALKATKFLDKTTTPGASGLDMPFLRLTVASKNGKTTETVLTGRTSAANDFVYARAEGGSQVVGIDTNDPKKFILTHDEFLDKQLFAFDESLVKKIQVKEALRTLTFTSQPGGAWSGKAEGATKEFQVEAAKMSALIFSLSSLEWSRRLDAKVPVDEAAIKEYKIDSPAREITLLDGAGAELARLGQAGEKDDTTYIRRGTGKDYFGVNKLKYNMVKSSMDEILKGAEAKKAD